MARKKDQTTDTKEVKAELRYLRISPRKVRLVADSVRGAHIKEAETKLLFIEKKSALPMRKLLNSALANAKNRGVDLDNLIVKNLFVNEGPVYKRFMPRAHGRASSIRKRTSHIVLVLGEKK